MKQTFIRLLMLLLLFNLLSCEEKEDVISPKVLEKDLVYEAKLFFESNYKQTSSQVQIDSKNPRNNFTKKPHWEKAYAKKTSRGEAVVIPLDIANNLAYGQGDKYIKLQDKLYMLMYKDLSGTMRTEVVTLLPDASYLVSSGKNKPFSGDIIISDWEGNFVKGFRFSDERTYRITSCHFHVEKPQIQGNDVKVTHGWEEYCITTHYYYYTDQQAPVYNGSETKCYYVYHHDPNRDAAWLEPADYPTWGGGGGGGGSGDDRPEDPCAGANYASGRASDATVANQNNKALADTKASGFEYGAEHNLTSPNGGAFMNTPVRTNGQASSFTPNFTWNSSSGYTIGATHGHPQNSAPSPADAMWWANKIYNQELIASGDVEFLKANAFLTTVTDYGIFVITIRDWNAYGIHNSNYNEQAARATYQAFAQSYRTLNTSATPQEMASYALLKMYGDAISLSKAPTGTTKFSAVVLNSSNVVVTTPCS